MMFDRQSIHIAMLLWGFIFCIITALCVFMSKSLEKDKRRWLFRMQVSCAVLLLSDAVAWTCRGISGQVGSYLVHISNFLVFLFSDIILCLYHGYVCMYLFGNPETKKEKRKVDVWIKAVYGIAFTGMILVVVSQFTHFYYYIDENNLYHRNSGYILASVLPMVGMLIDFAMIVKYRKHISRLTETALVSYIVLPFIATGIQMFYYGISFINIAISISMVLMFIVSMVEQNQKLAKKEQEALDLKIAILMSQIAPHFIYNTLASIQALCETDPEMAKETVGEFAGYLRGNLNSLTEKNLIPFEREMEHVKCYLAIEKKRFGERVDVKYDIREENFRLPPLTLQPMAENAVKHGLCRKADGGTLVIRTWREASDVKIEICDDGVGFSVEKLETESKAHVGIRNVRKRIQEMCNGRLEMESEPGKGTKVTITIPGKCK